MASLTVRNLDETLKTKLRVRAARMGRSMEEEVRIILATALADEEETHALADQIHQRFLAIGGFEMPIIERDPMSDPVTFEE